MKFRGFGKRFSQRGNNNERLLSSGHKRHVLGFKSTQTNLPTLKKYIYIYIESEVVGLFKESPNLM